MTRILIADDNEINCRLFGWQLESLGYTCDSAGSGKATIRACQDTAYDIVFLDLNLGDMDGHAVARTLRSHDAATGSHTIIIAATAHTEREHRERAMAAGMDDFVSKPVTLAPLATMLVRWGASDYLRPRAAEWDRSVYLEDAHEWLQELETRASNPGLADELMADFLERAPVHVTRMRRALGQDPDTVIRHAHALERHSVGIGALRLARALATVPTEPEHVERIAALVAQARAAIESKRG